MPCAHCAGGDDHAPLPADDAGAACHHGGSSTVAADGLPRLALTGSPNAGKTSIYNSLTGLRNRTGNYPGVTVARSTGSCRVGERTLVVEDLPGAYSMEALSPDERIVHDVLTGTAAGVETPDGVIVVVDATTLRRGLSFVAEVLGLQRPSCLAVTMTDELVKRGGSLDVAALGDALGVPAVRVIGNRATGIPELRERMAGFERWAVPPLAPPTDPAELRSWEDSVLAAADYRAPGEDRATEAADRILLNPVSGTLIFIAVMFGFFQVIFTVSPPIQDAIGNGFTALAGLVHSGLDASHPLLAGLLGDGLIGGVGSVLTFIPQIVLMFLMIALLEGIGYMPRAAFLMDRVMSRAGLEGRAFVSFLSGWACAIPGIMATRTLPSAKDRLATMMATPLMTCSARLPVYVIMVGLLVDSSTRVGPFSVGGLIMFALYFFGALSAMLVAWAVKKLTDRHGALLPFYMEMPPYRLPRPRTVALSIWDSSKGFLKKAGTIITATTLVLWVLLNVPIQSDASFAADCAADQQCQAVSAAVADPSSSTVVDEDGAPVTDPGDLDALLAAQRTAHTMDHSLAAGVGRFVEPVFEPLGFDWRVNIAILSSLAARETFVATLGQIAAAEDPENPTAQLSRMTYQTDTLTNQAGDPLFNPATVAAILVFFMFALQCMATVGTIRREAGTWKWALVAWGYMFVIAWIGGAAAHAVVAALM